MGPKKKGSKRGGRAGNGGAQARKRDSTPKTSKQGEPSDRDSSAEPLETADSTSASETSTPRGTTPEGDAAATETEISETPIEQESSGKQGAETLKPAPTAAPTKGDEPTATAVDTSASPASPEAPPQVPRTNPKRSAGSTAVAGHASSAGAGVQENAKTETKSAPADPVTTKDSNEDATKHKAQHTPPPQLPTKNPGRGKTQNDSGSAAAVSDDETETLQIETFNRVNVGPSQLRVKPVIIETGAESTAPKDKKDDPSTPVRQMSDFDFTNEEAVEFNVDPDTYFAGSDDEIVSPEVSSVSLHASPPSATGNRPRLLNPNTSESPESFKSTYSAESQRPQLVTVERVEPASEVAFAKPTLVQHRMSPVKPTRQETEPEESEAKETKPPKLELKPTPKDASAPDLKGGFSSDLMLPKGVSRNKVSAVTSAASASQTIKPADSGLQSGWVSKKSTKVDPLPPGTDGSTAGADIIGVCVVGFHHTRGPEVEYWVGPDGDQSHLWPYLPFQSLPDGSHSFEENMCYFTLLYDKKAHRAPNPTPERDEEGHIIDTSDFNNVETLFAVACSRSVDANSLTSKPDDVTRSAVQKSVVVVARKPIFGPIKEKLTVVTRSYFEQGDFEDHTVIDHLYDNLVHMFALPLAEGDFQIGTNLREVVHRFKNQLLVIFKALLLEKKVLFFANDTEVLCSSQFALVSLIPNLMNHLEDCGSPLLSSYETHLTKPTFLRTSDRESLLKFMGLPLQIFAGGGLFNPFVPLQQMEELTRNETQYGLVGSTNQLFLTSLKWDLIVRMDTGELEIDSALKPLLSLSSADKAFIDPVVNAVVQSWDSDTTWQPRSLAYHGGEDYIRHQFEDYIMGLAASVKYETYLARLGPQPPKIFTREFAPHPLRAFNQAWAEHWKTTNNYRIFNKYTDDELFDIIEPAHVGTIRNRRRVDAISDPRKSPMSPKQPKDERFSKFFGLFRRRPESEAPPPASPTGADSTSEPATPENASERDSSAATVPQTPPEPAASSEKTEAQSSPRKSYMFWR